MSQAAMRQNGLIIHAVKSTFIESNVAKDIFNFLLIILYLIKIRTLQVFEG